MNDPRSTYPKSRKGDPEGFEQNPSNLFSKLKGHLADRRIVLTRKQKIFLSGFGLLLVLLISLAVFSERSDQTDQGYQPVLNWKKLVIPEREPPFFSLQTATKKTFGVLPQETFTLSAKEPIEQEFVQENLESSVAMNIKRVSSKQFELTPANEVGFDNVVTVRMNTEGKESQGHTFDRDYSWAYQTQGKFRVISNIPGDKKTNVPVTTGIELKFSQDDYEDPSDFLEISPAISYRLERHDEVLAIVPNELLQEMTTYTVTLKSGLNLLSRNDPITQDYSFTFQTKELPPPRDTEPKATMNLNEDLQQITPGQQLTTKVNVYNWDMDEDVVKAKIYRLSSGQDFVDSRKKIDNIKSGWMSYFADKDRVDTSIYEMIAEAELKIQKQDSVTYLQLPDTLPAGYYIIDLHYNQENNLQQLWVQSTELSGYVSIGRRESLVWINEIGGSAVESAIIDVMGTSTQASTNSQGVGKFGTSLELFENGRHYVMASKDDRQVLLPVDPLKNRNTPNESVPDDYWTYLYHERTMYKSDDTINFWGVVKHRQTGTPANIRVTLTDSVYYYNQSETQTLMSKDLAPSADGTFIDNFDFAGFPEGWYSLNIMVGDVTVESSSVSITDYEKPEMKIEVSANKKAIFTDESVKYQAKVTFFDGTPAKHIPLKIYAGSDTVELESGNGGQLEYTYTPQHQSSRNYPRYESITINPYLAQQQIVEGHGSVSVYGSKIMMTTERERENEKATIRATVNRVDLEGINSGESNDTKGEAVSGHKVDMKITKSWYERREIGTYYDFVEKVVRKKYSYDRKQETVEDKQLSTDSSGVVYHDFDLEKERSYEVVLTAADEDGHKVVNRQFYYFNDHSPSAWQTGSEGRPMPELQLDQEESEFSVGEQVDLSILQGDGLYEDTAENRFLFILANKGEQETHITQSPTFNFQFADRHIPNIYAASVAFTGDNYEIVSTPCRWGWYCSPYSTYNKHEFFGLEIKYRHDDSQTDLVINTDRSAYGPGDEVTMTVSVSKNGSPLENTTVNVALADQALVAIGGVKKPSVLPSLYESVDSMVYYQYNTHIPVLPEPPVAEMGGGGGGDRSLFKDSAFFGQATTNENGTAEFVFGLPDNITTWVIYAQAVTTDIDAGQQESRLVATKEFFVTSQFPQEILEGDSGFITASSFGTDLDQSTSVEYEALFMQDDTELSKQIKQGKVFEGTDFAFPDLGTGDYRAVIRGRSADVEDGLSLPLKVIESRFVFETTNKWLLEAGESVNSIGSAGALKSRPIKIVVTDRGKGMYYYDLTRYCYLYSNRLEKLLAKIRADIVLTQTFDEGDMCDVGSEELSSFQHYDGGLAQVDWGGSDLETTAWAVFVDPDRFDTNVLTKYLESKFGQPNAGTMQKIYAAWGLSNIGQPRVNDLLVLAEIANTYQEKVLSGIALASIGETEKALDLYYDVLSDYAYEYPPYIRIQEKNPEQEELDSYVENSAAALLLGSMVENRYNEGLYEYTRDFRTQTEDIVLDLADIAYIQEELNKLPESDTRVSYLSNTQEIDEILTKGKNLAIDLSADELENFILTVDDGRAEAIAYYFVDPEQFDRLETDDRLQIVRNYKKIKGEGYNLQPGDIVEIKIDFDLDHDTAPRGGYFITDHLPSGFTYLNNPQAYGLERRGWVQPLEDNNKVRYNFYNSPWWQLHGQKSLKYYARVNAVGRYKAEPAVLQSRKDLSIFQGTEFDFVEISAE